MVSDELTKRTMFLGFSEIMSVVPFVSRKTFEVASDVPTGSSTPAAGKLVSATEIGDFPETTSLMIADSVIGATFEAVLLSQSAMSQWP
jgi:hypothetical protein